MDYKCLKCGYLWDGRADHTPVACPRCKQRSWNKPFRSKRELEEKIIELEQLLEVANSLLKERANG